MLNNGMLTVAKDDGEFLCYGNRTAAEKKRAKVAAERPDARVWQNLQGAGFYVVLDWNPEPAQAEPVAEVAPEPVVLLEVETDGGKLHFASGATMVLTGGEPEELKGHPSGGLIYLRNEEAQLCYQDLQPGAFGLPQDAAFLASFGDAPAAYMAVSVARAERFTGNHGRIMTHGGGSYALLADSVAGRSWDGREIPGVPGMTAKGLMRRARRYVATLPAAGGARAHFRALKAARA
jgi:hypothetical protein